MMTVHRIQHSACLQVLHCRDESTSFSEFAIATSKRISAPSALTRRMQPMLRHRHSLQSAHQPQWKRAREGSSAAEATDPLVTGADAVASEAAASAVEPDPLSSSADFAFQGVDV
jgi:hypothetical protein